MTNSEIKSLSFDEKVAYFRSIMNNLDDKNEYDILNVFRLVNTYNVFDDEFFNQESSYIRDISEFIDIKMALENDIKEFSLVLIRWYFAVLASCDITVDESDKDIEELPMLVYGFFSSASISVMSAIMNSIDLTEIDMSNLPRVKGAFSLVSTMFESHAFVASFLSKM